MSIIGLPLSWVTQNLVSLTQNLKPEGKTPWKITSGKWQQKFINNSTTQAKHNEQGRQWNNELHIKNDRKMILTLQDITYFVEGILTTCLGWEIDNRRYQNNIKIL